MSRGFLLDTHAVLWWLFEAERLSQHSLDVMADRKIDIYVSAVTPMEITTKFRKGQLPGAAPIIGKFAETAVAEGWKPLAIELAHSDMAGSFASPHRDPWDRLLAAQASIENLALVTSDAQMASFEIATYW